MKLIRFQELRGRIAFKNGMGTYANPYRPNTLRYALWLEGWYQAKQESLNA